MSKTATPRDMIPDAHCVLGTMLRPFSLGHHLLLDQVRSDFCGNPNATEDIEGLALAVFVCAAPYSQTIEALLRGEWAGAFGDWSKKIHRRGWLRRRHWDAYAERQKFAAYLEDGYRRPPVWRHAGGAIKFSAPWECLVESRLTSAGFSNVREIYLPAAWYYFYTLAEIAQADNCADPAKWRRVFYTDEEHAALNPQPAKN